MAVDRDAGATRILLVFLSVVAMLLSFYGGLTWQALKWSPSFFVAYADSDHVRAGLQEGPPLAALPVHESSRRGRELFRRLGCVLCHGPEGEGGLHNPNYIKDTIPELAGLAERMFVFDQADADTIQSTFDAGEPLDEQHLKGVSRAAAILAQYRSIRGVIEDGNPAGKADPSGKDPLDMPAWKEQLNGSQVNDLIGYLLSLYPWETEDEGDW